MKIYTKKGDDGSTGLLGGTRVSKQSLRIETYGTLDELNSFIGLLRDHLKDQGTTAQLIKIQESIFTMGSHLAADPVKNKMMLPSLEDAWINELERSIDKMESDLPPMKNFILPGGHVAVSYTHVCRTICRRCERLCVALNASEGIDVFILKYLNRLSDYFFVLSRKIAKDFDAPETPWAPNR